MVAQTWNPNPQEAEAKGLQIQDHSKLDVLKIKFQKVYAINPGEHAQPQSYSVTEAFPWKPASLHSRETAPIVSGEKMYPIIIELTN